ncbi:hypothetical protein [Chlorogloea sp. CCALA 695]|uniref:hypothetical protein n=1 Tax=Chlorogloea sp. CCALA 695 TaxID=2107693 RepID=UPI000D0699CB|nr:hypothetical protein [Chlorogloea sp. CCALA 695]PSB29173.1 hypothetical protein C7B70_18855 [Chlorogloea sp. CCALA 695]
MLQHLKLELSDKVYADLQQKVNAVRLSITEWIVALLSEQGSLITTILSSEEQQEKARQRFRNYARAISRGYATGIDNASIDADLARAYTNDY